MPVEIRDGVALRGPRLDAYRIRPEICRIGQRVAFDGAIGAKYGAPDPATPAGIALPNV